MPRFFVENEQIKDNIVKIYGEDFHHISRSLRMKKGQTICVCDNDKNEYTAVLDTFEDTCVTASVISSQKSMSENPYTIKLYQAYPKHDKLDFIIQKAVECGVSEIIPFTSERCVVQIKKEDDKKHLRRQKIAHEAAKQSSRAYVPQVRPCIDFKTAITQSSNSALSLFCYEGEKSIKIGSALKALKEIPHGKEISVFVGSEGGFSETEVNFAKECGLCIVGLGQRILRCETASLFALSCVVLMSELI